MFRKGQTVRVSRSTPDVEQTIEAKVTDWQDNSGKWEYKLKDENGKQVWLEKPTWISESDLSEVSPQ
jgi:hypothetical protein